MNELREMIRHEIEARGTLSFARFMELSLYCPEFGYYERLTNTPGHHGDFYTSVSVGSLFGELLAFQFAQWATENGPSGTNDARTNAFQIVEAGAHDGRLAADVLNWLKARRPDVLEKTEYWILEPSARRQQWQRETLTGFTAQVRWFNSWDAPPVTGVRGAIFSNELLDAMPVHRLGWDAKAKTWFEWGVGCEAGNFVWRKLPLEDDRGASVAASGSATRHSPCVTLQPFLRPELRAVLPDGFTTEICPAAVEWWRRAASALKQGYLLTFDYGLTAGEFFLPQRAQGTLRACQRHRLSDDPLANVGEQDLTADVNFTALQSAGESAGLENEGLFSQTEFLTRIAEAAWKAAPAFGDWTPSRARQFQTLTHPEHLGRRFRALIQTR